MNTLTPPETLYDRERGRESRDLPLPLDLLTLYGPLQFPLHPSRAYVIGNFVTTLDGVVSLGIPGRAGGGEISGFNRHDHLVMGLLRAIADTVTVGAGTLWSVPHRRWTAEDIYPAQALAYQQLRTTLGKAEPPLTVIVTAHGEIDLDLPVFQAGEVPVLLVTTTQGLERIREQPLPLSEQTAAAQDASLLTARSILEATSRVRQRDMILVEGGPQLLGDFFAERLLDELFLTLAPQIVGRDEHSWRPGLVMGKRAELPLQAVLFAPLRWLEQKRPDFYRQYAEPVLARAEGWSEQCT